MAEPAVTRAAAPAVDYDDIQGLVRFGHGHLTHACFLLLRVANKRRARIWLAQAPITSAVAVDPPPPVALHVALSSAGLRALGVPDDIVEGFSPEFVSGLGRDESRARRLGDVGDSAPSRWQWGTGERRPDVLVMLYATTDTLDAWRDRISAQVEVAFELLTCLATDALSGTEPFGFPIGLTQPKIDWARRRAVEDRDLLHWTNVACLGEFVLGYPNEYAGYTDRPLIDPARDGESGLLPRAEDAPDRADVGRNGSYLVLRQLRQDVRGFWRFLDEHAGGNAQRRQHLAEAMIGRAMNGEPLVGRTGRAIDGIDPQHDASSAFDYGADLHGLRCPQGAHVRRSNPRNGDVPSGSDGTIGRVVRKFGFDSAAREQDLVASARLHRLLRRGRSYGRRLSLDEALADWPTGGGRADDEGMGLHFMCLNASIARQFEFVQGTWLGGTRFNGLPEESDPLVGQRDPPGEGEAGDHFSVPRADGQPARVEGLPTFVTVRGGAYFFLPGLRALRYLATV